MSIDKLIIDKKIFDHDFLQPTEEFYGWKKQFYNIIYKFDEDARYCFTDKESYLAWVSDWKEAYNWLSDEIREAKKNRKISVHRGTSNQPFEEAYSWAMKAYKGSELATRMLALRQEAKQLSWDMKQTSEGAEA